MPQANGPITDVYCGGERVSLIEKKDYLAFLGGRVSKDQGLWHLRNNSSG